MSYISGGRPIEVLMVEDDPADVKLTMRLMRDTKLKVSLNVVEDGAAALDYLRRKGEHKDAPRPDLMLLDLNLPKKNGREVLKEIKADEELKTLPVVILTTSDSEEDIAATYGDGAASYITKPVGLKEFGRLVQSIEGFWFTVVKYPPRD